MPGVFITTSSSVSPQFREFERFTTAALCAFVGPKMRTYIGRLESSLRKVGVRGDLRIMASNGGVATPAMVEEKPVATLLSGLAAGVLGGAWVGALSGRRKLITFDIGGTSADVGLVVDGRYAETDPRSTSIAGFPLLMPMIDIHTIGAGGGSIAYVDQGGAFRVGPRSAGAVPGPAAYGRGGAQPTVTDANVVLGRLDKEDFLGGSMKLDDAASHRVIEALSGQTWVGQARDGRRRADRDQQQHGECDPLAHGAEGRGPARVRARRIRRRWAASRRGSRARFWASPKSSCPPTPASRPRWAC